MKRFILAIATVAMSVPAFGQVYVHGYTTKNGTYVAPYYRSSPNGTTLDNYSTKGNVNPYTGQPGTRNPQPNSGYTPYQSPYTNSAPKALPSIWGSNSTDNPDRN